MKTVVALGDNPFLEGFTLVGVRCISTTTADETIAAWDGLDPQVGLVILTPTAAADLGDRLDARDNLLAVVTP